MVFNFPTVSTKRNERATSKPMSENDFSTCKIFGIFGSMINTFKLKCSKCNFMALKKETSHSCFLSIENALVFVFYTNTNLEGTGQRQGFQIGSCPDLLSTQVVNVCKNACNCRSIWVPCGSTINRSI